MPNASKTQSIAQIRGRIIFSALSWVEIPGRDPDDGLNQAMVACDLDCKWGRFVVPTSDLDALREIYGEFSIEDLATGDKSYTLFVSDSHQDGTTIVWEANKKQFIVIDWN